MDKISQKGLLSDEIEHEKRNQVLMAGVWIQELSCGPKWSASCMSCQVSLCDEKIPSELVISQVIARAMDLEDE